MDLCSGRTGLSACVSRPKLATTSGPLDGALERTRGALEIAGDDPDPAGGAGEGRGGFTHTRAGRTDRPCCPTPRRQPPRQAGTRRRSKPSSMPAEPPHPAARTGARLHPPPCSRADCAGHRPGSSAASWGGAVTSRLTTHDHPLNAAYPTLPDLFTIVAPCCRQTRRPPGAAPPVRPHTTAAAPILLAAVLEGTGILRSVLGAVTTGAHAKEAAVPRAHRQRRRATNPACRPAPAFPARDERPARRLSPSGRAPA